jgi:hypothetical protein
VASTIKKSVILSFLFTTLATAQSPSAPTVPQLSPQSAYDQVMRPFDITRNAISNWSGSELNALAVVIKQATDACRDRTPDQFSGDDLIAYARLCALGQQWPIVNTAATQYIASPDPAKPQLARAYAFQINAALHSNDTQAILDDSLAMLHAVPYTSITDETLSAALRYLQLAFTPAALKLYAVRQPILLAALRAPQPSTNAEVPLHILYADGVAYAALQQFAGAPQSAVTTVTELDAALPSTLQPDNSIPIAETRRQYALLGAHLPAISFTSSVSAPDEPPHINPDYGTATVLFLFPDWCAQCIRLAQQLYPTLSRVNQSDMGEIHLYALLAQGAQPVAAATKIPSKPALPRSKSPASKPAQPEPPKTPVEQLQGTPTLVVAPDTLTQFAAADFPLLIAIDHEGIVRFIQPANETALNPGDFLDQITAHIAQQWPQATSTPASPPATAKP